jgi:two-component system, response regulator PdtaR
MRATFAHPQMTKGLPMTTPHPPVAVLIAEDQPLIRMAAADHLVEAGYRVLEANDAEEAMALIEARSDVRVLVTDVKMPGEIDGIALAHIVSKRWPEVGIVITSGHAVPEASDLPAGATFLTKPYWPSQLIAAVADQVGRLATTGPAIAPEDDVVVPDAEAATEAMAPSPEPVAEPDERRRTKSDEGDA